ncbi:guanylate-binding protein [Scenedesmus sp. NREL 46B-D3]|nr:guanylate-binding protein [Scenedesmus sp. NREL 46B-D3]
MYAAAAVADVGFGVGHTRETETKGIWVWGQPQTAAGGSKTVLYVDTEGFESTGRSNSYDDRVFAVATVMSSLLIYNLPETIRGSDVSKLSFVVELAAGFYDHANKSSVAVPVEPGSMLWVIQRDFLQGKSVQQLVTDALAPVPNPHKDQAIAETNNIRASLASIARNSTGFSLPQPHLDRTKLCELGDAQLEPKYVAQRDALKQLVLQQAGQKVVGGEVLTGKRLAALLQSLVAALNAKEIPTGAGLIDSFNREAVSKALAAFTAALDQAVQLPVDEAVLDQAERRAREEALSVFKEQLLGCRQAEALQAQLDAAVTKEAKAKRTANQAESNVVCQAHEMKCAKQLAGMAGALQIPSMRQFEGRYAACLATFEAKCVGPARSSSAERLQLAWSQARMQFGKDYNDRLFTGLLVAAVADIVIFRFVIKAALLEAAGWLAVVFLELYPHLLGGAGNMYTTRWWKATAAVWEALVLLLFGAGGLLLWVSCGVAAVLGWQRVRRRQQHKKAVLTSPLGDVRDLDV